MTSHVPLRDVADAISVEGVGEAVEIIDRGLCAGRRRAPADRGDRLNPHAGDGGSIGREEIDVIAPAIERARAHGIDVVGPLPSDTVFIAAKRGDFDAVVSMYHDQGQIAMKLMGFDSGVTLHGGLPVPVATCRQRYRLRHRRQETSPTWRACSRPSTSRWRSRRARRDAGKARRQAQESRVEMRSRS